MNYLDFYKTYIKTKRLPKPGLCSCISERSIKIFFPTKENFEDLKKENKDYIFWASESGGSDIWGGPKLKSSTRKFTPLRQNIILLLAAINGEL